MTLSPKERRIRLRLRDDFQHFAKKCLKIRAKEEMELEDGTKSKIVPFSLNKAQRYIHAQLEKQLQDKGKVRALILKGRQQGCSTLVGARFYHKTTHRKGFKTFILTHRDDATDNLFKMVKRYHEHNNPLVKPSTSFSNRKELVFDKLDSAYGLGTAGGGDVGRSDTVDLFHGSEVAFWKNVQDIKTGLFQAAGGAQEIILESTANGYDEMFYPMWQAAEAGLSEYQAIFVPWYWQDEYQIEVGEDFELTKDEQKLYRLYKSEGMTKSNLAWRRNKIASEFSGDNILFLQEYPNCATDAFQVTGIDAFIKPENVIECRKRKNIQARGAHIVGLDPARGGDRTAWIHRQGKKAFDLESMPTPDTKVIAGKIREMFELGIDWLFIDVGGLGGPIYDMVKDLSFGDYVIPVNFGSKKDVYNKDRYFNKRAEMWGEMRDWLENDTEQAQIPDSDELQADICAPSYRYDDLQRYILESKEKMKDRGVRSPDCGDALALTFAQPVSPRGYDDPAEDDYTGEAIL